jgi:deoxyribose-phosphate aldolase
METEKFARLIDHTLLRQDARVSDVERLCAEALRYKFCSVITQPWYVKDVRKYLSEEGVLCGTVVGFPFGTEFPDVKEYQAKRAVDEGAQEIDMVMNMSAFKNKDYAFVEKDIAGVVRVAKIPIKVIIETSLLSCHEIIKACEIVINGGADYVKTSTGYFGCGATPEIVRLMKTACMGKIKIKAAGGIRTYEEMKALVDAGADRIGTSKAVNIICNL